MFQEMLGVLVAVVAVWTAESHEVGSKAAVQRSVRQLEQIKRELEAVAADLGEDGTSAVEAVQRAIDAVRVAGPRRNASPMPNR